MDTVSLAPTNWDAVKDPMMETDQRYAMDSKLYVNFYLRPVLQQTKSDEANRPIFVDVEHVRIMVPGDKLSIVDRVASPDDKARFADHYAKFKAGQGDQVVGTRLEAVPWMSRSKVEEYKFFGIFTVEQLAVASDEVGQKFQGFQSDKSKAQVFLDSASGTNARVKELERQVATLLAQQQMSKNEASDSPGQELPQGPNLEPSQRAERKAK
jgi:hypothetical protein